MKEELIKRHVTILEIRNKQPGITLANRYYYDMFCGDIINYIHFISYMHLSHYGACVIKKVVISNKIDVTHHVLYNKAYIDKKVSEISTMPCMFEVDNLYMLLDAIEKLTESAIIGDIKVSIYFDFFIVNEVTMFFKYEIYKCLF
jgi:hypothetical protein